VTVRREDLSGAALDAFRVWHNFFGLSESAALNAVVADGLVGVSEDDRLAGSFRGIFSLTESAARVAAEGRRQASELGVSRSEPDVAERRLQVAEAALAAMSDAEVDRMYAEEQQRPKFRAKTTPAKSGGAAKKSATVVSEWDRRR
jgi:hypothetical protein